MQEQQKGSAGKEAHEQIEYDFDENKMYQIEDMSLDNKKEKLEWRKRAYI